MADTPVARPSSPSVRFAPFETAMMIKMMIGINARNVHFAYPFPSREIIIE